jgi:hypothetical protein
VSEDLAEDAVGAGLVLGIGGMVFIPGFGDEPAKGIIVFRIEDQMEKFFLFPWGTGFFHVPAEQVSQSLGCFHINKVSSGFRTEDWKTPEEE